MAQDKKVVTKKTAQKTAVTKKTAAKAAPITPKPPAQRSTAAPATQKSTAPKAVAKKTVTKKAITKKTAVAKKSVAKKTAAAREPLEDRAVALKPVRSASPEERYRMIEEAAYYRAEKRGFAPGGEGEDWAAAVAEIDAMLTGKG